MVEAAGVEPDISVENAQLIDSENARIGMISIIAKSTVRSLYGHFPECLQLPNSTFRRPLICEMSILKFVFSISQIWSASRRHGGSRRVRTHPLFQSFDSSLNSFQRYPSLSAQCTLSVTSSPSWEHNGLASRLGGWISGKPANRRSVPASWDRATFQSP